MEYGRLLEIVGNEPSFETGLLLAGDVKPFDIRRQLSRWTEAGKIYQLRRGLYCLAPPYQKVIPHPFLIANRLQPASYISRQSALAFYGIIPERAPMTTSVTTRRPIAINNPLGYFDFRHIQVSWLRGYAQTDLGNNQNAFVATPEKALLDLVYLQPGGDAASYLRSLRLQALEQLDLTRLHEFANLSGKPKLRRAAAVIQQLIEEEASEYHSL